MLELKEHASAWIWCASGKHPVSKDYFQIGNENPVLKAFSDWVEKGYFKWLAQPQKSPGLNSWRFWAKGSKKNHLICGLAKDSSDQFGRPYPLLVMGSGSLKDWESHWNLLPFALSVVWEKMEYLSSGRRFTDLKQLEKEIIQVPHPLDHWSELKSSQEQIRQTMSGHVYESLLKSLNVFWKNLDCFIALNNHLLFESFKTAEQCHALLKAHLSFIPNAVFMGGAPENACIGIFGRPLLPEDFVKLWTTPDMNKWDIAK